MVGVGRATGLEATGHHIFLDLAAMVGLKAFVHVPANFGPWLHIKYMLELTSTYAVAVAD